MKPLIGLTPIVDAGRDSLWMLPGYMQGLEAVGGIGMMLPLTDDAAMLKDIVDRVDGLLLTGGNDVAPVLYGETKETFCGENDPRRDRMEARLIELALQADKPVFGICRGLQILNVVLGGTLYQDLKTQTGTEITHSMDKPYDRTVHEVNILPDTPLAALYGPGPLAVNSRHHQGIKGLAPALHAQAVGDGGVDLHRLERLLTLLVGGLILHRAHIVRAVGDLDEDDALAMAMSILRRFSICSSSLLV